MARARRLRGGDAGGGRVARRGGAPAVAAPQPAALPPRQGARAVRRLPPTQAAALRGSKYLWIPVPPFNVTMYSK